MPVLINIFFLTAAALAITAGGEAKQKRACRSFQRTEQRTKQRTKQRTDWACGQLTKLMMSAWRRVDKPVASFGSSALKIVGRFLGWETSPVGGQELMCLVAVNTPGISGSSPDWIF